MIKSWKLAEWLYPLFEKLIFIRTMCQKLVIPSRVSENVVGVVFSGFPALGKGTQAGLLSQVYDCHHLSTGELIRQKCQEDENFKVKYQPKILTGTMLPDDVTLSLVQEKIPFIVGDRRQITILDGLPRNRRQCGMLENVFSHPNHLICFDFFVPDARLAIERAITNRKREDDELAALSRRCGDWQDSRPVVMRKMRAQGINVVSVDACMSIEETHGFIQENLVRHLTLLRRTTVLRSVKHRKNYVAKRTAVN